MMISSINSDKNTAFSSKPSKAIRLLLMVLFVFLFANVASAQTNTWDGSSNNNWNTAANWSLNAVPTNAHDVVINTTAVILVDANATINSLTINGSSTVSFTSSGGGRTITIDDTGSSIGLGSTLTLQGSTGSGTRSMTIAYSGTNRTISIAGTLVLTNVGDGTNYDANNSTTTVTGTILNNEDTGIINSSTTNLVFASGGTYRHELDGGTIPTATWNVNSNCNIIGLTTNEPSGDGQAFGNLIYNCSGMTGNIDMAGSGLSIAGNFQVINTGSGQLRMSQTPLTVSGNCTISDNFRIASGTSRTLNVNGDFTLNGGSLDMCSGGNGDIGTLNITGNLTHTGGTMSESGTGSALGAIVFNKTGTQIFTSGGTVSNTISYTVNSGSTLQMASATTVVAGNSFVLSSGATLGITSTAGITAAVGTATGNIRTTGARTFNIGASYIYNGSAAQTVGTGLPATVSNLAVSNSAGVTMAQATTITNNFSITSGAIANLGTYTHTAGTLTLGGVTQVPESWGSTSSPADNKNDTYFSSTVGLVNNSCTPPTITSQPLALTICENSGGSFSILAPGAFSYQWQYSTDAGVNWLNTNALLGFAGHTSATLTLTSIPSSYNGYRVRCIVRSSSGCRTNSNSALLTINSILAAPTIGTISQPTCATATGSVDLSGLPTGSWALTRTPGNVSTTGTGTSTTISGLAAGTYTYAVNGLTNGLQADYYSNIDLSGVPVLTRTDATVGFDWVNGSPDASINNDDFSIRWTGFVEPLYSQTYTFTTRSDDGIRLWVNGVQIINNWTIHAATNNSGTIALTAGVKYSIVLEYYEKAGQALAQLSWSSTSQVSQIIPASQLFSVASCGSTVSANVVINAQPTTLTNATISVPSPLCSGDSLNPTNPTITTAGSTVIASGWQLETTVGGGVFSNLSIPYTLAYSDNGKRIRYYATNGCGTTYSNLIVLSVNSTPTITPNKVNETCPSSNNGSISPTLSGGLTNIRYIKLTQKYADYQQVAEIQALEIFTGTNVALATNGAVASSKSIYSDIPGSFGPQLAINGILTSSPTPQTASGFYHSKGKLDEWIIVDLQSGKNLDKLVLFNRTDCCYDRGQNMLLELFDNSNNLIYTKTVNLWGGINGSNSTEINILDVSWADGATTLNRTALDSGTYTLNYSDAVGCSASSPIVIGATNTTPSTPILGTTTQPDCVTHTGSIVLDGLQIGGTINQTGTATATYTVTAETMTITGLAAGTYNFTASNGSCFSSATENVVMNASETNTWTGSAWSHGTPNSTQKLVFAGNYPPAVYPNVDITGCSCMVTGGATVTIKSGNTLTITNEVTVVGGGNLIFDYDDTLGANPISSGSLVQINDVANSGNIKYLRRTNTNVISTDYTYWSSPVSGQTMFNLSPNTLPSMFYSYQVTATNEDWQQESSGITMAPGIGYIIGGPKVITPPDTFLATFTGVPNNGTITLSNVFENKSYLLGNPYPSAIDANLFLNQNAKVLGGTLYFWTHNTDLQDRNDLYDPITNTTTAGSGALAYTSNDYATYNGTGGVGAYDPGSSTSAAINPGGNTSIPSGQIAAGQGFFASTQESIPTGSSIVFNNNIRLAGVTSGVKNNAQFFKTKNPESKTSNTIEKHRIWLNLFNTQGAFKQTLIGYVTDATNEYDNRFDGESFDGNKFVDFYSINQDKNLVIQGRALPFDENDEVPLGYRTSINGDFSIKIEQTDGLLSNQNVFIEDKLTNTVFDLKNGNYTFNTAVGTFNDRFVLRFKDKTLGTTDFDVKENTVLVSIKNKQIKINSFAKTIDKVTIYDTLGRQIFQRNNVNSNEFSIGNLISSHQTLIVKTSLLNGKTVTDKIIY